MGSANIHATHAHGVNVYVMNADYGLLKRCPLEDVGQNSNFFNGT